MTLQSFFLSSSIILMTAQAALATTEYDDGVRAFRSKNYNSALSYFDKAIAADPNDSNAYYYKAVVSAQLGKPAEAKEIYTTLIQRFGNTPAGLNAAAAMAYLDPAYLQQIRMGMSGRRSARSTVTQTSTTRIYSPNDGQQTSNVQNSTVYFENMGSLVVVPALINGRPFKMIFDSGAHGCTIGVNDYKELGFKPPEGDFTFHGGGIGSEGIVGGWEVKVTLKVGDIEKRNFPIAVMANNATQPLLGQTFFKEFHYSIDNADKSIRFSRSSAGSAVAHDSNSLPFKREGNHILVSVQVDGKPIDCYLDTGATACVFSQSHAQQLGIKIPDDARTITFNGVAGSEQDTLVTVNNIRCGPISKNDFEIAISPSPIAHPLLGQSFFGSLRFDLDEDDHLLRFRY